MAEAAPLNSNILCRYYMHGACREGSNCRYSHDNSTKPSLVCQYYIKGKCSYGDTCRYDHTRPRKNHRNMKSGGISGNGSSSSSSQSSCAATPGQVGSGRLGSPAGRREERTGGAAGSPSRHRKATGSRRGGVRPVSLPKQRASDERSRMVTLTKEGGPASDSGDAAPAPAKLPSEWAQAAEFVPGRVWQGSGPSSYSQAAHRGIESPPPPLLPADVPEMPSPGMAQEMCPYAAHGACRFGEQCTYMHGDECDMCGKAILHPTDRMQRQQHHEACVREHEEDMQLSFAVARSADKTCGICMEVVVEKLPPNERRFGILSNCSHVFCLSCIRKWRAAKHFQNKIIRACPECRVKSDFVTPNKYWVDEKEEKEELIDSYKKVLSTKPCKYFKEGRGECPFNANCFYRHAYPDGRPASPVAVQRRQRSNGAGELDLINQILLWDFLEERGRQLAGGDDVDFDSLLYLIHSWNSSDSESDLSDFELYI